MISVARSVKAKAYRIGFDLCGIAGRFEPAHRGYFLDWLREKRFAGMAWLGRNSGLRLNPRDILPGARSAVVVGVSYAHDEPSHDYALARYARGRDYHDWMRAKLNELEAFIRERYAPALVARSFVDTGPVLERDLAEAAGLGWIGKNTCLINREAGSYVFLGVLFTDLEMPADAPVADACRDCRLCVDACPTGALGEYRLDPAKCLAYHNIEKRGERERDFWEAVGTRLLGCDDCQEVCPWNAAAPRTRQSEWLASFAAHDLGDLRAIFRSDEAVYKARVKGSAVSRVKYLDFMRNAFLAAANAGRADLLGDVEDWGRRHPGADLAEWRHCVEVLRVPSR